MQDLRTKSTWYFKRNTFFMNEYSMLVNSFETLRKESG